MKKQITFEQLKDLIKEATQADKEGGTDFKAVNSALNQIVALVSDCRDDVEDLARLESRYGRALVTSLSRKKIMDTMSEVRKIAHNISQEMK